jgi:AcrR family transcriptional regulator
MALKTEIIGKCVTLFKTYGIKSNTMDDIAGELGISKKTLYHYITDKRNLVEQCIHVELLAMESKLKAILLASSNPVEHLIRLNIFVLNFLKGINPSADYDLRKHYPVIYDNAKEQFNTLIINAIRSNIEQGVQQNLYLPEINTEAITQIHSSRLEQVHYSQKLWEQNQASPGIIKDMINYYIRGLVSEKGLLLLNKQMNKFEEYLNK